MSVSSIYVNLPVSDISRTRTFWQKLGFTFNEQFSDEKALALVLKEGTIYAMLISKAHFTTFTNRPLADGSTTQVITAIQVDTREKVDELVRLALENGATRFKDGVDLGWMYYDSFSDPDGHQWEVMNANLQNLPQ